MFPNDWWCMVTVLPEWSSVGSVHVLMYPDITEEYLLPSYGFRYIGVRIHAQLLDKGY